MSDLYPHHRKVQPVTPAEYAHPDRTHPVDAPADITFDPRVKTGKIVGGCGGEEA